MINFHDSVLDRVSNLVPLALQSDALLTALHGPLENGKTKISAVLQ